MKKAKHIEYLCIGFAISMGLFFFFPFDCNAEPPYCSNVCDWGSSCDTACTGDSGEAVTCRQWGVCSPDSSAKTSITIEKAYPYAFPDPYGFGLRMEYRITLARGHQAISVTTQYSPDGGETWYTDENARAPTYNWDNIHGHIECGSAKYNLESGRTYTLRAILHYRANGLQYDAFSNHMEATVEDYDPPVLYQSVGHLPEGVRIDWQNAGLLPETPTSADHLLEVTSMPGSDLDAKIHEAIERARRAWRQRSETTIISFPPGRYRIRSPIELKPGDSNIIFQGAGAEGASATILECQVGRDGTCFDIHGSTGGAPQYDLSSRLNADIQKGERSLGASLPRCPAGSDDPACFSAGDWIHLWESSFPAESGAVVGQITRIESVSPRLVMSDAASKTYSRKYALKVQKFQPVRNIGIENLKIYRIDSPKSTENRYGSGNNIRFHRAVNCWVRGVESELTCRHHVVISMSAHIEISGCYLHVARFYGGNSYGYGIVLGESATNCLIENNVFRRLRHAMGIGTGANSNVLAFNYSREQHSTYSWWIFKDIVYQDSDICLHGRYPFANLFEHNVVEFIEADDTHGKNGPYNTFLRNRAYERRIELYGAPQSSILGCDTDDDPAVKAWGGTSFGIQAYGKSYLVGGAFVPYENAPWISYFDDHFALMYHPDKPVFAMLKDISYYYPSRPYFLSSRYTWPALGPDLDNPYLKQRETGNYRMVSQTIPAEQRYESGHETYIQHPTLISP